MAISRAADSSESEPWTMLKVTSRAKSPRIDPGAASTGWWRRSAGGLDGFGAFEDSSDQRAAGDEVNQLAEEGLFAVLGVVLVGNLLASGQLLQGDDAKALALEPGEDFTGEGARRRRA